MKDRRRRGWAKPALRVGGFRCRPAWEGTESRAAGNCFLRQGHGCNSSCAWISFYALPEELSIERQRTADDRRTGFPARWGRLSTNGERINECGVVIRGQVSVDGLPSIRLRQVITFSPKKCATPAAEVGKAFRVGNRLYAREHGCLRASCWMVGKAIRRAARLFPPAHVQ